MSVSPSIRPSLRLLACSSVRPYGSTRLPMFVNLTFVDFFRKSVEKIQVSFKNQFEKHTAVHGLLQYYETSKT
jgi:hypothetical protein